MSITSMNIIIVCTLVALSFKDVGSQSRQNSYASILQDARNEPTPDGNFGYLYKTEDGIVSAARGDPSGKIQGRFSYTDPTGLKVNINYNAGSRFYRRKNAQAASPSAQGYYNDAPATSARNAAPEEYDDGQYRRGDEGAYVPEPLAPAPLPPAPLPPAPLPPAPRPRPIYSTRRQSYAPFASTRGKALRRLNDVYAAPSYRA